MRLRTWLSDTIHKKALFIALVHWYVTFFFEKDLFIRSTLESKTFTVAKIIVIFSFWQIAAYMFRRYKREADYRRFMHFSAIYFLFSMGGLLMIWPGNWGWEKMGLIGVVRNFEQYAWHHYLMIWFYYYATLLLPSPVSVIILQLACLSLIVGYFVYSVSETIHRSKLAWLAYIPFIFPSVLAQNYFPLRATLFAYIVLLLLVILIKSISRQKNVTSKLFIALSILTALISTIRGEGVYFLVAIPILFIIIFWKTSTRFQKTLFPILTAILFLIVNYPQSKIMGPIDHQKYILTTYTEPLGSLVNKAMQDNRPDLIEDIDKYLRVSNFKDVSGAYAYWHTDLIREGFYEADKTDLYRALLKLIYTYPDVFIKDRWATFQFGQTPIVVTETVGYTAGSAPSEVYDTVFKGGLSDYLSPKTRDRTLQFIALQTSKTARAFFHNILIPLGLIVFLSLVLLILKQYKTLLCVICPLPMAVLAFLAAQTGFFMYYFSVYLFGYAAFFVAAILIIYKLTNMICLPSKTGSDKALY